MRKTLVLTITFGEKYKEIASLTHPTLKRYADRIGADFKVITEKLISKEFIHFEKFQIYDLLLEYERIIFIDSDIIVRDDAPSLFDIVPYNELGAFNEGFLDRAGALSVICQKYGQKFKEDWDGCYYNTGVLVISRLHRPLFKLPSEQHVIGHFYEQDYLNMKIYLDKIKTFKLDYKFNRMSCVDKYVGENRHASYFIHYAGCPVDPCPIIKMDLNRWERDSPKYEYKKNILITLEGGIGDAVDAEPVIRYISEKSYPGENIVVYTAPLYNRLIEHISGIRIINDLKDLEPDTAFYHVSTYKDVWGESWKYMNQNLMHVTDFASLLTIRRIIPFEEKEIQLPVKEEEYAILDKLLGKSYDYSKLVLIHPGKSWNSRTFPKDWWDSVVDELLIRKYEVGIIGKYVDETLGVVDVDVKDGVHDFRNILELGELFALIKRANVLITNDSSPVHIAGAYDNWIVLIPTSRHPEHLLAPRKGDRYYKTVVAYKDLMDKPSDAVPTMFHGKICNYVPEGKNIYDFIPDAKELVEKMHKTINS
jgi:ADP-heptose:LPS heptosyltransferase